MSGRNLVRADWWIELVGGWPKWLDSTYALYVFFNVIEYRNLSKFARVPNSPKSKKGLFLKKIRFYKAHDELRILFYD